MLYYDYMAKQKKKRNKPYANASATRPTITRVSAVQRSRPRQWWHDNKRIAKPALIAAGVVIAIIILIVEIIRLTQSA